MLLQELAAVVWAGADGLGEGASRTVVGVEPKSDANGSGRCTSMPVTNAPFWCRRSTVQATVVEVDGSVRWDAVAWSRKQISKQVLVEDEASGRHVLRLVDGSVRWDAVQAHLRTHAVLSWLVPSWV